MYRLVQVLHRGDNAIVLCLLKLFGQNLDDCERAFDVVLVRVPQDAAAATGAAVIRD